MGRARRILRLTIRGGMIAALAAATAACGSGGSSSSSSSTASTTSTPLCNAFLEQFGFGFCQRYKAAANTDPLDANPTDIVAVDPTLNPIEIPAGT